MTQALATLIITGVEIAVEQFPKLVEAIQAIKASATMSAEEKTKAISDLRAQLLDDDARVQAYTPRNV